MNNPCRVLVKMPSGSIICVLEVLPFPPDETVPTNGDAHDQEGKITDRQQRYLFTLLGKKGLENSAAENHLKERFKVQSLGDISKKAASLYINQLVAETKEAASNES